MEKINPYLKYLNITLVVTIVSTMIMLYMFVNRINIIYSNNFEILLVILPCVLGGTAAALLSNGIRGIIVSMVVGALSFCIWSSIYVSLLTIITSTDPWGIVMLVVWIPGTLVIGGIMGLIGGVIGIFIKKLYEYIRK
ncbi:MAG: hypothetical protein HZC47_01360 [Methanobacterium sp.]|uniref:hypothetical protein n=1 Tax=Methanobacterium sp. TaxID=2164 RepID=UPI003D660382|nr:hypothetical protein [Methanobacterium sp.]